MSIQKITKEELFKNGIQSLPTRPSTPSLYAGSILSAEELKAAFDKLPTLVAERFNDLLSATGLFDSEHPAETFAELIATNLSASHSLKDFFEDVKNGNLALYLTANAEGKSLSDVISDLWRAIESKKSYTVSIEGDGDLLSDASFENEHLTLKREGHIQNIVKLANAYADAPQGSVSKDCTLPVSGKSVFHAIEEESEKQGRRIETLENAASGILYTYPIEEEVFRYKLVEEDILPNTALLAMGAAPIKPVNLLPEASIANFSNDHLTITWDEEKGELVFNGTALAEESPFLLTDFSKSYPGHKYFSFASFYRGGTIDTGYSTLRLISNGNDEVDFEICEEDYHSNRGCFENGNAFSQLQLVAYEDTVFENYRINLLVSHAQTYPQYEPHYSRFRFKMPKALTCIGPNHWFGEESLTGETYVSFHPPWKEGHGTYMIGMKIKSSNVDAVRSMVRLYSGDKLVSTKRVFLHDFKCFTVKSSVPVTEVRVFAANSEADSEGCSVTISNIYVQPIPPGYEGETVYTKGHKDEIIFPDTFPLYSDYFMGTGKTNCDYFDFEKNTFTSCYTYITVDGSPDFVLEEGYTNRFSAPFDVPTELQNSKEYYLSDFFYALTTVYYQERLWFTKDRVYVQSELFRDKDPAAVKWFLNHYPVDVAYKSGSRYDEFDLTREEKEALGNKTLRLVPGSYLYFRDEEDNPIETYAKIQYQVKQTTEVTQ